MILASTHQVFGEDDEVLGGGVSSVNPSAMTRGGGEAGVAGGMARRQAQRMPSR